MNSSRYLRNLSLSCAGMLLTIFACAHKSVPNSSGQRHFFEKRLQEREASRRPDDIEALGANFEAKELAHLNLKREYLLYTPPSYDPQKPSPLVIAFHGGTTSDARLARTTRYHKLADKKGFLVLYPNGVGGNWNDGRGTANPQIDDVSFVKALIEEVGRARKVDQRRIYATGISNGALMVQRLACEMSDRIAAFASVAGSMSVLLQEKCKPQRPVSMLIMNSPDDKFIPWQGGAMKRGAGGTLLSVDATIEFWKKWYAVINRFFLSYIPLNLLE